MKQLQSTVDLWLIPPSALADFCHMSSSLVGVNDRCCAARHTDLPQALWYAQKQAAVRYLLASYTGDDPAELCFRYGPQGKPFLLDDDGLEFNVSHSNGYTVVAVTKNIPIGIDIEYIKARPRDELAMRIFGPSAADQYRMLSERMRCISFSFAWSEREALSKMLGLGIGDGWGRVISDFSSYSLMRIPLFGASRVVSGYKIYYLNILPSHSLAFCTASEISSITVNYLPNHDEFRKKFRGEDFIPIRL